MPAKKNITLFNTLLVGCLWTFAYFPLCRHFISNRWGFDIFWVNAWANLFSDFKNAKWMVNSWETFLFFTALLLLVPIWILIWYWLRTVNLVDGIKKIFEKKSASVKSNEPLTYKKFVPQKLKIQSSGIGYSQLKKQSDTPQTSPKTTEPEHFSNDKAIADIVQFSKQFNLEQFVSVTLLGHKLDLSLATDDVALVIMVLDRPNANWFFDSEQDAEDASWFSEQGRIPSPIFILEEVKKALTASNPEARLISAIVFNSGGLMDYDDAKMICDGRDIQLVQFNNPEHPEMPALQSIIEENFTKKEESNG